MPKDLWTSKINYEKQPYEIRSNKEVQELFRKPNLIAIRDRANSAM